MMMLLEILGRHRARHLFRSSHLTTTVTLYGVCRSSVTTGDTVIGDRKANYLQSD